MHEHLLVFKKEHVWQIPISISINVVRSLKDSVVATWRDLVQAAIQELGGIATLKQLYASLKETKKAQQAPHYEAKIRQVLQIHSEFEPLERGKWRLSHNRESILKTA